MALSSELRLTSFFLVHFRPLFSALGHCPRSGFLELQFLSTGHPRRRDKEDTRERKVEEEGSNGTVLINDGSDRGSWNGKIVTTELLKEAKEAYMASAMSVLLSRALPDVRDGLKPVHRRILKWREASMLGASYCHSHYSTTAADTRASYSLNGLISHGRVQKAHKSKPDYQAVDEIPQDNTVSVHVQSAGKRISAEDKKRLLVNTLLDLKDSKEIVYGTLDAWVAWEQNFPLAMLKRALLVLEKGEQWHRIVQVLKWMLSKGQGTTMGTYEQLICALEKDNRPEEAHTIWVKKISYDLHSVPWRFCDLMLSIYYRNNMLERLVKLFEDIESYGRKPPSKSIVRKVVDAYELLGLLEEKNRVLQKYDDLCNSSRESPKKLRKFSKRGIAAGFFQKLLYGDMKIVNMHVQ
ncbi:pentatricopeptide repeat-containing protein At4g21190 isoform X2 [Phalaenopsis equestris]|uniref:pentatricopeptide repeat-containing protein At4g21190 isoform X2 n=1 Tax=Phalaenopsis equestris TaxID=78828 RepID=UPI0009E38B19|nr:pentatricopeptide repeat-containing protein At4g21190 isoform X2 [Phalaenopsis equestris]